MIIILLTHLEDILESLYLLQSKHVFSCADPSTAYYAIYS